MSQAAWGQNGRVSFERISSEEGLHNTKVSAVVQDSLGFIWFGTQDGVVRYDGFSLLPLQHDPTDSTSLSDSFVMTVYADLSGTLWVGTRGGGLNRYDLRTRRFTRYQHRAGDPSSLASDLVYAVYEAPSKPGILWVGTSDGLSRLERTPDGRYQALDLSHLLAGPVYALYEAPSSPGHLWVGAAQGLFRLTIETGASIAFPLQGAKGTRDTAVLALLEDRAGVLWAGTRTGLMTVERQTGHLIPFRFPPGAFVAPNNIAVRSLLEDQQGWLWIATGGSVTGGAPNGRGLFRLTPRRERLEHYSYQLLDAHSLLFNDVYSLYLDRSGVVWIPTWAGVNRYVPTRHKFTVYEPERDAPSTLSHPVVVPIYEDAHGMLWIGTRGGGLNRFDRKTGRFTHYRHRPGDPHSLSFDEVWSLWPSQTGALWVGTYGGGLNRLDPETGRFTVFRHNAEDSLSLSDNRVQSIYEDRKGRLWIGTREGGLNRLDAQTGRFIHYRSRTNDPSSLSSDYVWPIREDDEGKLWIGTIGGGLNHFDPETGRAVRYRHEPNDPTSLRSDRIFSIYVEGKKAVWIGTMGGGLNRLDRATGRFEAFTEKDGLVDDLVQSIIPDDAGRLWLGTNNGFSCFDPRTRTFTNYDVSDGLPSNVFHVAAAWKSATGELIFGGQNGFFLFHPDNLVKNTTPPPVVLTELRVFDQPLALDQSVETLKELTLEYDQRFFSLRFAALDYAAPEKNQYAYLLEGFDNDWRRSGARGFASYTNVSHGTYTFRVRASNNDGVWNNAGLALKVTVKKPYWATWWFRLLIGGVLLGALAAVYNLRVRRLLEIERMRVRIAGNLHDDVGANLSSIAIKSEIVLARDRFDEQARRQLSEISRSARDTAHTLREIVWVVNAGYDTLDQLITRLEDVTAAMLEGHMTYTFDRPPVVPAQRIKMDFRQNVYFLYKELLHNVVKHARASHVGVLVSLEDGILSVQVKDNGVGFSEDQVKHGNGLRLLRKRASDIRGQLQITSSPGEGTRVVLRTPV